MSWFNKHFIPHLGNGNRPHFLRDQVFVWMFTLVSLVEVVYLSSFAFERFWGWSSWATSLELFLTYLLLVVATATFISLILAIFIKIRVQYLDLIMNGLVLVGYILILLIMNQVITLNMGINLPPTDWMLTLT